MGIVVKLNDLNIEGMVDKIVGRKDVGLFLAETAAKHMEKYVPADSNTLGGGYITRPWEVEYAQPYAHYQYEGELYLAANGSSFAKRFETKYPSGQALNYKRNVHMLATSHWDEAAQEKQGEKIAAEVTEYLRR